MRISIWYLVFCIKPNTEYLIHVPCATIALMILFLAGCGLSVVAVWAAIRLFPRLGLLDFPERYGLHRARVPYPGGVVLCMIATIFFSLFPALWFLAVSVFILGALSFWDDRKPLPALWRGIVHIGIAAFVFANGIRIEFVGNPFSDGQSIDFTVFPVISFLLTVAWIVVIQNAMNWFDGLKGLSVGVSGIGFLTLGIFGILRPEVAWESGLPVFLSMNFFFAGMCVGAFLFFFFGKIILGDTGSQVLGFLLAVLSIFAGTKIAVTLLVLGLPILDAFFVMMRRIFWEHRSPIAGDQKHLHHNLARRIGEKNAVLILILLSAILGSVGLFLTGAAKFSALLVAVFAIAGLSWWAGKAV